MTQDAHNGKGPTGPELDALIRAAESAVVARDHRVRLHVHQLGDGLRSRAGKSAMTFAGVAIGGFLLARLLPSRRRRRREQALMDAAYYGMPPHSGIHWGRWLALAAPFVPMALRSRVSPGAAAMITTFGMPLLQGLLGRRRLR